MIWQNNSYLHKATSIFILLTIMSLPFSTAMLSICSPIMFVLLLLQMQNSDWRTTLDYPVNFWLLMFFSFTLVGVFYSAAPLSFALAHFLRHMFLLVPLMLIPFCKKNTRFANQCLLALIVTSTASAFAGIIHYAFLPHQAFQDPAFAFGSHIYDSLFEAFAAFAAAHFIKHEHFEPKYNKFFYGVIILITFHLMILSAARTGDLVLFGLLAYLLWHYSSGQIRILGLLMFAALAIIAVMYLPIMHHNFMLVYQNYVNYFQGDLTSSIGARLDESKLALQIWMHKPIFGYGTSGYWQGALYVHQLHPDEVYYTNFQNVIYYPENTFLFVLAEHGIVGLVLLIGVLVSAWRMSLQLPEFRLLTRGLLIAFVLFSLSQASLYIHSSQTFFVIFFSTLLYTHQTSKHWNFNK